jgi:hypothetical protein
MSQIVSNESQSEDRRNLCRFEQCQPLESTETLAPISGQMSVQMSGQMSGQSSPPPYSTIPGTVPLYNSSRTAGPPPSYEDVINPEAPPPSYQSLFGQVREARKTANGILDFIRKLIFLLIGTLGCTIIIGFTVVIPLSMIIIGIVYMNSCPIENIPTFLLVGGIVWIFKNLMNIWSQCRRSPNSESEAETAVQYRKHESLLNCFLFGWFIAGCVMVYRVYEPNYDDPNSSKYCNKTVYMYAFWLISSTFIVFAIFMTCLCGITISAVFSNSEEQET